MTELYTGVVDHGCPRRYGDSTHRSKECSK
jgi:hypothetical protein